jgi:hypothetical protein
MTEKKKRGYSREFPTGGPIRRKLWIDWVPPGLLQDAKRKAKRDGVSLRALTLTLWKEWLERG